MMAVLQYIMTKSSAGIGLFTLFVCFDLFVYLLIKILSCAHAATSNIHY